jgi:hypothetical protein
VQRCVSDSLPAWKLIPGLLKWNQRFALNAHLNLLRMFGFRIVPACPLILRQNQKSQIPQLSGQLRHPQTQLGEAVSIAFMATT